LTRVESFVFIAHQLKQKFYFYDGQIRQQWKDNIEWLLGLLLFSMGLPIAWEEVTSIK